MNDNATDRKGCLRTLRVAGWSGRLRLSHRGARGEDPQQGWRGILREEGANLVEMALACAVFFAMLFGIIEFSLAVYSYTFINEAAREATRFAVVRGGGTESCTPNTSFPNCNLNPATTGNSQSAWTQNSTTDPIRNYIISLGYPGLSASNLTVNTTWYQNNGSQPATWATTACTATMQTNGTTCNADGNEVQVTVTYAFPLHIPFWKSGSIPLPSTSEMVISF